MAPETVRDSAPIEGAEVQAAQESPSLSAKRVLTGFIILSVARIGTQILGFVALVIAAHRLGQTLSFLQRLLADIDLLVHHRLLGQLDLLLAKRDLDGFALSDRPIAGSGGNVAAKTASDILYSNED